MTSEQHPDRDSLNAYLEEALSIDATQWLRHHLAGCAECRARLEQERAFLRRLDGLRTVEVPVDFTAGVMARVAQYPAYQPATEVSWRRLAVWAGSLAALLVVGLGVGGWLLMTLPAEGQEAAGYASSGIVAVAQAAKNVYLWGAEAVETATPLVQPIGTLLAGVLAYFRGSSLAFQLAVLLITVALNYLFTRMVLNYQRRQ
jgi:anti-sigma factor RsiW